MKVMLAFEKTWDLAELTVPEPWQGRFDPYEVPDEMVERLRVAREEYEAAKAEIGVHLGVDLS